MVVFQYKLMLSMQWSSSNISWVNISHSFAVLEQMASMDLPRGKHATRWDALYSEVECKSSKLFDVCTEVPGKSSSTSMWSPNVLGVGPGPLRNRHIQEWAIVLLGGNGFYQGLFQIVTSFPHNLWGENWYSLPHYRWNWLQTHAELEACCTFEKTWDMSK